VSDDTNDGAVLLDLAEISVDGSLPVLVLPLCRMTLEGLLLRRVPESKAILMSTKHAIKRL
jgi:hypothetical protein